VIGRVVFILLTLVLLAAAHDPEIRYFTNVREVQISAPDKQNYVVIDSEVWGHARPDLADIRLYDGTTQVPFILQEQQPRKATVEKEASLLNLGTVGDHTEFDLDVGSAHPYDRIRFQIDANDFIATALIFGRDSLNQKSRTQLGPSTLYDFTREKLGSNFVVQLPTSSFRYLHVQFTPGLHPEQIKGAAVFDVQEKRANWTRVGNCRQPEQLARNTVVTCSLPPGVPLDRIQFEVAPEQMNFRRNVSVSASAVQIANGDISRFRVSRGGTQVLSEQMFVDVPATAEKRDFTVTTANGDDPPLKLLKLEPLALERRICFDPSGRLSLKLYYGDPKLEPAIYDYAKFFQEDPAAVQAQLGPGIHNTEYAGRPDERPWSERHKAVVWAAMLVAVAVLATLAFRGLTSKPSS
jgi:uncharacterized protein DUF3999